MNAFAGAGPRAAENSSIEIEDLVKKYDEVTALKGINPVIPSAQLFGLLGPNGAGKTTALKVIRTLLQPTGGTVRVLGKNVQTEPYQGATTHWVRAGDRNTL